MIFEDENLADVSAARNVLGARTMASLASLMRRAALGVQRGFPVRGLLPAVVNSFVAGLAGIASYVLRGFSFILRGRT